MSREVAIVINIFAKKITFLEVLLLILWQNVVVSVSSPVQPWTS